MRIHPASKATTSYSTARTAFDPRHILSFQLSGKCGGPAGDGCYVANMQPGAPCWIGGEEQARERWRDRRDLVDLGAGGLATLAEHLDAYAASVRGRS